MATGSTTELDEQRPTQSVALMTELNVSGMTCSNCARHVTEAIQSVPGVHSATVNLEASRASVRWTVPPDPAAVIHAVSEAGYEACVVEPGTDGEHSALRLKGWELNLCLGGLCTLLLMLGEWVFGLGTTRWFQWLSFGLASVVQVLAGARFYRGAWSQLKVGSSNMDTLVALGSTTAFAYSTWALLTGMPGHVYFMEAAAIITLISLGHWIESCVSVRASSALRKLLNLAPEMARRRGPDGSDQRVPVAQLQTNDTVLLSPGDCVPTDGVVLEGESATDESMLTGESVPAEKTIGSELYAGTLVVNGRLAMRVTATGEATALAHIIASVQRAQTSRANIQRLGDRVSSVFVPVVVVLALGAGFWWGLAPASAHQVHDWLGRFLWAGHVPEGRLAAACIISAAVLIIACPCAMGLATPAAIMAGSNAAAQSGILIRDGIALERAGEVTAVLFDKTGTLTTGKLDVVEVWQSDPANSQPGSQAGERSESKSVQWAAALARHSNHPVSQAIARRSTTDLDVNRWEEKRGQGVVGEIAGSGHGSIQLGSLRWLRESAVNLAHVQAFIEKWSAQGATVVGLAQERALLALFAVQDTLKPGSRDVVEQLRRQGLKTYLVTGDNLLTAVSFARQAGVLPEHVFAEVQPEKKAELVQKLQQQGERVAFVGDGINDAPALEQADLGIAVSRASDIAREAADIILLNSEIEAVPESLGLARATLRTIKQNLFWAFFYNAIGVPLAALGFMSPILCAAAMGLSDMVVIGNALRLRRRRGPPAVN